MTSASTIRFLFVFAFVKRISWIVRGSFMAEDDKLKYLTFQGSSLSCSSHCCQNLLLSLLGNKWYPVWRQDINVPEQCERNAVCARVHPCLCVCVLERSASPLASASSAVMGRDESEPNQCALPLGFIPVPALHQLQPQRWARRGKINIREPKPELMLSPIRVTFNQLPVSQHVPSEDQRTHSRSTHTNMCHCFLCHWISGLGHPWGSVLL